MEEPGLARLVFEGDHLKGTKWLSPARFGRSLRQDIPRVLGGNNPAGLMEVRDCRKNIRVRRNFPVRLFMEDLNLSIEGITTNLSQGGAFIKSKNRHSCQAGALVVLTLFLPL